ncbi:MAG: hypothetical protein RML35_12025 [Chloroherpetonaceae bacterium]|nr:hypothetical protein [Chloroherpetonaceae bacterium]
MVGRRKEREFNRGERISIMAAYQSGRVIEPFTWIGYYPVVK